MDARCLPYGAFVLGVSWAMCAQAAQTPADVAAFLESHCIACHGGGAAEAGLDIDALGEPAEDPLAERRWSRLIERVEAGEMPPVDGGQPAPAARDDFVKETSAWLRAGIGARDARYGRVRSRRLSRREVERSLHELLGIDIPLAKWLPDEGRPRGFTTVAERQTMSHHLLERHLSVVDMALDEAFRRALQEPDADAYVRRFDAVGLCRSDPKVRTREPELLDGRGVIWSNGIIYYGRVPATSAPDDGWYRFTLRIAALNPPETGGVWSTVNAGLCVSSAPLLDFVTAFEAMPEFRDVSFEAWLPRKHMLEIRPGDATLKQAKFMGGQVGAGEGTPQEVPGIAMESLAMERFHRGPDDDGVRKLLFGHVPCERTGKRGALQARPFSAREDMATLITAFSRRAYRRPVEAAQIEPVVALTRRLIDQGESFTAALRAGYRAILCSPRFLHLVEDPGPLDDHATATRLSYFLTGGPPDETLTALADAGGLGDPAVLRREVDRLLGIDREIPGANDRLARFVRDFSAEWLDLDQIDFTEPDRKLYPGFDQVVQQSMLAETHAFVEEMFRANLPIATLALAEKTYLNSRLARFYEIDGVDGDELRPVAVGRDARRGGLLTQGAILKVTANGNDTSPVIRGIFVRERLLGIDVPPPPANVPAIEPDIRGATTIREQLARHRSDASCGSCHRGIDPCGFALENFDPSGRWRDHYIAMERGKRKLGAAVEPGDQLPDGRHFSGIEEFRELLASRPEELARGLASQLLVYGTGAMVSFKDREAVTEIVTAAAREGYGVRSILHAVVSHPVFLSK